MLWIFLSGFALTILGIIDAIKYKNKKIIIILVMCLILWLISLSFLVPGLLFAFSNWEF
jgi:hypothetical protein